METCNALISRASGKGLDRVAEDLEAAAARRGLQVTAIHDLVPGLEDCRVYVICHAERAREALARTPEAAILVPCRILLRREAAGTRLTAISPGALLREVPGLADLAAEMEEAIVRTLREAAR